MSNNTNNNNILKKYCKIINEDTKEVQIGLGTNINFYKSIGFEEKEIVAVDNRYYLKGSEPKPNLLKLKVIKLDTLKDNTINFFYTYYPLHRQNNLAIFGTEEEKLKFKEFHDTIANVYDLKVRQIEKAETVEQLNKIKITEEVFNEAPF